MRVLITGGAGFIGYHLSRALLSRGDSVHVVDDLSTGSADNLKRLVSEFGLDRLTWAVGTCRDVVLMWPEVCKADVVVHLAAAVGVKLVCENQIRTLETNVGGTQTVLDLCAKAGKKVLIASTSEVYGKSTALPFKEDGDLVLGPTSLGRWGYACSKALDEFLALAYHHERQLPVVIFRLFNITSTYQAARYGMVLPRFVEAALKDEPVLVYGDGEQKRCFCDVRDAVRALLLLIDQPHVVGQVFNIGSTDEISIWDLAHRVVKRLGSKSPVRTVPYATAYGADVGFQDMARRVPDLTKIRREIGWEPLIDLDTIIDHVSVGFWPVISSAESESAE